jgi:ArsR family transcriptional regulator
MAKDQEVIYRLHAEVCKVLGHPLRIAIIDHLQDSEMSAGELARLMEVSKANLSQHLGIMRHNGIVEARREGSHLFYRITNPKVVQACRLMREVMLERVTSNEILIHQALAQEERNS